MEAGSWKFFEQLNSPEVYPKPVEGFPLFSFSLPERSRRQRKRKGFPLKSGCEKFEIKKYRRVNL